MIGKLKGIVDEIQNDRLILDVGGVGYAVFSPRPLLEQAQLGQAQTLWIETHMSEHALTLYGFPSEAMRAWFNRLIAVHGVGMKAGLALLSFPLGGDYQSLGEVIKAGDSATLSQAPGIGKKLAERLIIELKNKIPADEMGDNIVPFSGKAPMTSSSSAISALVNLGYAENVARATVSRVLAAAAGAGAGGTADEAPPIEETIKTCLQELAR